MSNQRYSVTPYPIETLLSWVKSGEIAIPETTPLLNGSKNKSLFRLALIEK